jgi:hypothetical protein
LVTGAATEMSPSEDDLLPGFRQQRIDQRIAAQI